MTFLLAAGEAASRYTNFETLLPHIVSLGVEVGKRLLMALVIYFAGRFLIRMLLRLLEGMLSRRKVDAGVRSFLHSMASIVLMVLLFVSIVGALGVNTASFAALLASAGVAIGMALSGNLQNFAGGLIILLFKPYRVGDWIEAQGQTGEVMQIQIFHTILRQGDHKMSYIPNGALSSSLIVNLSRAEKRRLQWTVGVAYGTDLAKAMKLAQDTLSADGRVLSDPAPFVGVDNLGDSSVDLCVRCWVLNADYWGVYYDGLRALYEAYEREGIDIPFPQRVVHTVPGR